MPSRPKGSRPFRPTRIESGGKVYLVGSETDVQILENGVFKRIDHEKVQDVVMLYRLKRREYFSRSFTKSF